MRVLERFGLKNIGPDKRWRLKMIEQSSDLCQIYVQKPRRFKFTLCYDKDFNHTVYDDIFYKYGKPIVHVVDEVTSFQSAKSLIDMTFETF